jgi:hypothetical protein
MRTNTPLSGMEASAWRDKSNLLFFRVDLVTSGSVLKDEVIDLSRKTYCIRDIEL